MQRFHDNQVLNYMAAKMWGGQPVLCITDDRGKCRDDGLLVTLKTGTDLQRTFERLTVNLWGGAGSPLELSGNEAITYMNGEAYLDINKLLPEADGSPPRILR